MLSFDAPSLPSPLAVRECTRPRFDGNLRMLRDWLGELRAGGVRQAGPGLILALENLRKTEISAGRRLAILSALKVPLLKTCAGLPKPRRPGVRVAPRHGVTLEQHLYRLMFLNLNQALRQLDQERLLPSRPQQRRREWAIRNLFRFANRQVRYAVHWSTPLPENTWRGIHELHVYLRMRRPILAGSNSEPEVPLSWIDPELEYKKLLLFGLAARLREALVRDEDFLDELEDRAAQILLEDPHRMLGRLRLFLVDISEDAPPHQRMEPLDVTFCGWVLQLPQALVHQLEDEDLELGPMDSRALNWPSRLDFNEVARDRYIW